MNGKRAIAAKCAATKGSGAGQHKRILNRWQAHLGRMIDHQRSGNQGVARHIDLPCEFDFMAVSSYGASTRSSGVVRIVKDLDIDLTDRHVLLVEDIVDSGLTLRYLMKNLAARGPASLEVCSLLVKDRDRPSQPDVAYVGFTVPSDFVVGYGLDVDERYRNLPDIRTYKD